MVNPLGFLCNAFILGVDWVVYRPRRGSKKPKAGGGILNPATSQWLSNILSLNLNMEFGHHIFDTLSNTVHDSISSVYHTFT